MLSWEEKFHAADGKAQACNQGALLFFLSSFGGGEVWGGGRGAGGEGFFSFFPGSQCVPFKFSMGSQYVAQVSNVFPNIFSIAPHFYPICFGKCCPPFTYRTGPKGRNFVVQNRTFYSGETP